MFFIGRGDLRSSAGVHRTPLRLWRFESIHSFGAVGNLYQKMHFAGSNLSTDRKSPKCIYKILKNFRVEKFLVICWLRQRDIVASDSDIASLRSAVILYSPPKLAKRIPLGVSRISLRSNRTRRKANITEKSTCLGKCFFLAGVAGFGPTNARVKVWCLTAWLHPNVLLN